MQGPMTPEQLDEYINQQLWLLVVLVGADAIREWLDKMDAEYGWQDGIKGGS